MKTIKDFVLDQASSLIFLTVAVWLSTAVRVEMHIPQVPILNGGFGIAIVKALIIILIWIVLTIAYGFVAGKD